MQKYLRVKTIRTGNKVRPDIDIPANSGTDMSVVSYSDDMTEATILLDSETSIVMPKQEAIKEDIAVIPKEISDRITRTKD